ncbi:MAG TPA: hypothetical protein VFQ65_20535, partial [Kofleriaceae bacterium]|nr:hypothetical protein [Kofleriaceae bacterium]
MSYVLYLLTAILVLDSIRMRGRVGKLAVLEPSDAPPTGYRAIAAPGIELQPETIRAAAAYARTHELALLDLVPRNLGAMRALGFAQLVDPVDYRADKLGPGRTAGHAILVEDAVFERAGAAVPTDDEAFAKLASRIKHYGRSDAAIAPLERAHAQDLANRYKLLYTALGPGTPIALGVLVAMWALIGLGLWLSPLAGLIALAAWQLQPLIGLGGTHLRPRDLLPFTLLRAPIELYVLARTLAGRRPDADAAASAKPVYDKLIAEGLDRFAEIEPVERGLGQLGARRDAEVTVTGTDVEPPRWRRDIAHHVEAIEVRLLAEPKDELHARLAEPVVKIFVIEVEPGERQPRVLEHVTAGAATF